MMDLPLKEKCVPHLVHRDRTSQGVHRPVRQEPELFVLVTPFGDSFVIISVLTFCLPFWQWEVEQSSKLVDTL